MKTMNYILVVGSALFQILFSFGYAYGSGYEDLHTLEKTVNNSMFINLCKENIPLSERNFLLLDGPNLRSSHQIYNSVLEEEKLSYPIVDEHKPSITVVQIDESDYNESISLLEKTNFISPAGLYESNKVMIRGHLVRSSANEYLLNFKGEDNQFPNCVYLDYMGSAGGNYERDHFPFEDLDLFFKKSKKNPDQSISVLAVTFSMRTAQMPVQYSGEDIGDIQTVIKSHIDNRIDFYGYKILNAYFKPYQRKFDDGSSGQNMLTVYYVLEKLQKNRIKTHSSRLEMFSPKLVIDVANKKFYLKKWGYSSHKRENWIELDQTSLRSQSLWPKHLEKIKETIDKSPSKGYSGDHEIIKLAWYMYYINRGFVTARELSRLEHINTQEPIPIYLKSYIGQISTAEKFTFEQHDQEKAKNDGYTSNVKEKRNFDYSNSFYVNLLKSNKSYFQTKKTAKRGSSQLNLQQNPKKQRTSSLQEMDDPETFRLQVMNRHHYGIFNKNTEVILNEKKFIVKDTVGKPYFLEEFLNLEGRLQISEINNIEILAAEGPWRFNKLLLKTIPHKPERFSADLPLFYRNIFKIENLIESLPEYETSQEKLASVLIEILIWEQVGQRVSYQVEDYFTDKADYQLYEQVDDQVYKQVEAQVEDRILAQVQDSVWAQIQNGVEAQSKDQLRNLVDDHVYEYVRNVTYEELYESISDEVSKNLLDLGFSLVFKNRYSNDALKPWIDYLFMFYQLGTLAMRHSEDIKHIHRELVQFISLRINEKQATIILKRLEIPNAPEGNFLVETQLKLLRRLIGSQF